MSSPVSIFNWLEKSNKCMVKKLSERECHHFYHTLTKINSATFKLRQVKPTLPTFNTEFLKNYFIKRLSFNYNLQPM